MYRIFYSILFFAIISTQINSIELDTTFGDNGKVILNFGQNSGHMNKVIPFRFKLLPDGKILLAGDIYSNKSDQGHWEGKAFVARYAIDGHLDTEFGKDGITILDIGKYNTATFDIALQSNGNILVAGRGSHVGPYAVDPDGFSYIACLDANGFVNQWFGNNGVVQLSSQKVGAGYLCSGYYQLEVKEDDTIFVGGHQGILFKPDENKHIASADYKAIIVKYTKDGVVDRSFGDNGIASTSFINGPKNDADGWAIAIQKDGKIIIVGDSDVSTGCINLTQINGTQRAAIARFHASGKLDETFGNNGNVYLPLETKGAMFFNVILDKQERIIATGFAHNNTTNKAEFLIVRYLQDGNLDTSFGQKGILLIPTGKNDAYAYGTVIQPDEKILITGIAQWENYKRFTLVRCTSDGQLDTSFGSDNNGIYAVSLREHDDRSFALMLLDNQRLLIAGDSFNGEYFDSAIAQFRLN